MKSPRIVALCVVAAIALTTCTRVSAWEPADPDLLPPARKLLDYLQSIEGKGILAGVQRTGPRSGPLEALLQKSRREPALYGTNLSGFNVAGSEQWHANMRAQTDAVLFWWQQKGAVINSLSHWGNPMHPGGSAWKNRPRESVPPDIGKMVTEGTQEYEAFHKNLGFIADYLEELAEEGVPVLWSPLHEIEGGWFWWTDSETPENTAALYRQMFDYLVKQRQIHNLIWVYHAAHRCGKFEGMVRQDPGLTLEDEIAHRARFYPGDDYVDIVSLSTYGNKRIGWGNGWEDARQAAYELMRGVAPNKPLAINETPQPIHPLMAQKAGLAWLWSRAWWSNAPTDWVDYAFNHDYMITLDELPVLHGGNVMPNVRIDWPTDALAMERGEVYLSGIATDRNGNLEKVQVYVIAEPFGGGPWLQWMERPYDDVLKQVEEHGTMLGTARMGAGGRWAFTYADPPSGYLQFVALASDTEGAVAHSNVIRATVGVQDLAAGKPVTVSGTDEWGMRAGHTAEKAVDGDPWTVWWADRKAREEPQWIQVDLGASRSVGAVAALWGRPYPQDYRVEVSDDGEAWREVARMEERAYRPHGASHVIRFEPVKARYVRLKCMEPQQSWMTYALHHLGVHESLPKKE